MEASDVASGSPEQTNEMPQAESSSSQPSIAEMMAKHGTKSSANEVDLQPISINKPSSDETRSAKADSPVAPTTEESRSTDSVSDTNYNQTDYVLDSQIEAELLALGDWKALIKNENSDDVLTALGFDNKTANFVKGLQGVDEKMVNFLDHWKNGGNLKEYIEESSKDFSSMPPEDVMRHQLRVDYPKANEAQLEVLYKKEIAEKYNLNSYDEDEVNEGKLLLEAKADKYRDELSKAQESKLLPQSQSKEISEAQQAQEKQVEETRNKIVSDFNNNPYTKEVLSKNAITIGKGDDKFSFQIDAAEVANIALYGDTNLMFDKQVDSNGQEIYTPKSEHQLLVATVNKYGERFITELAKHYKSLGSKAAIEPLENAKPSENRNSSTASAEPTTVSGAMAKYGRLNSGGW